MIFVNVAFLIVRMQNSVEQFTGIVVEAESVNSFKGRLDRLCYGMIKKLNTAGQLTIKEPEAEEI